MAKLNPIDEEKVASLLLRWEDAWESGEEITAEDLCTDTPELLEPLSQQILVLKRMAWMRVEGSEVDEEGDAKDSLIGSVIANRYEIKTRLSHGGFGVVYQGYDRELERDVAIKVTRQDKNKDQTQLLEEAKRTAKLRHNGIVSVFDVVRQGDLVFVIAEFVQGMNLAEVIEQEPTSIQQSIRTVTELADALQFAHDQGFIHNDIKPSNILINQAGRPLISDFGSSVSRTQAESERLEASGTLPFMAPELLEDHVVQFDVRSDLYSLGVVLYQLLTGKLPFESASPLNLREQILNNPALSPRSLNRLVPKQLEAICLKCLSKNPSERYQSAAELKDALTKLDASNSFPNSIVLASVTSLIFLAAILWIASTSEWFERVRSPVGQVLEIKEEGTHSNCIAYSSNGKLLATGGMDNDVHLWDVQTGECVLTLRGHENWIRSLVFSSDGDSIFTASGGIGFDESMHIGSDHTIREWSVSKGEEVKRFVGHQKPVRSVAINHAQDTIASASEDGTVRLWDRLTGKEKLQLALSEGFPTSLAFSSLARLVLVGTSDGKILVWDILDNKLIRSIAAHDGYVHSVVVAPNQRTFLSAGADKTAKLWSDRSKSLRLSCPHNDAVLSVAFTSDSARFLTGSDDGVVRLWDSATGKELHQFYGHLGNVWSVAFSPDGKHAASAGNDKTIRIWRLPR